MIERVFSRITALVITFAMVFSACSSIVFAAETPVVEKQLVSIACFGQNGTISISTAPDQVNDGNPEYYVGNEITFTVTPKDGYYLHGVDFSGGYPGQGAGDSASYDQINPLFTSSFENGVQTLTLTVPKPTTGNQLMIYANFEQIPYDMEVQIFGEGSITVNPKKAKGGDTVVFKPEPAAGYELTGLGFVSFTENSDGEMSPTAPTAIDPAFTKNNDGSYSSIVPENITKLLLFGANFTKIPEVIPEAPKLNDRFTENGITYQVTSLEKPTVSVVGYTNAMPAEVELPGTVTYKDKAFTVTAIGGHAFYDCIGLKSVTIPGGVTAIDEGAFYGCTGLTSITIPESVTTISDHVFGGCKALTSITMPKVTSVGASAFENCTVLTSISMPNVTSVGASAFENCTVLTSISMPKVTSVGASTFENCTVLTSISMPKVTSIGASTFIDCAALTSITIPASVTSIGNNAFLNCDSLKEIIFLEKPKDGKYSISIDSSAFLNINSNAKFYGYNPTPPVGIPQDRWMNLAGGSPDLPDKITVTVGSEIIKTTINPITSATAVIFDKYAASVDESLVCIGGADISIDESAEGKTAVVALTFSREAVSQYDVSKAIELHLNDNGVMDKLLVNVTYKNDYAVLTSIARKFSPFAVYAPLKTDTSTDTSTDPSTDTSTNPSTDTSTNPSTDTSTNTSTSTSKNISTKPSTHSTPKPLTSNNPKTGDSSNIFPWVALLFVSGGVLTALGTKKKNHKQR